MIVPTVSLAIDQERSARNSIKVSETGEIYCYYSGTNNFAEIKSAIESKKLRLLFISPEALIKNEQFSQLIESANKDKYLKNIIIDEAHIVVAWGDFFRVDYQCISPWRNNLLQVNPALRTFLLSATYRDDTVSALKSLFSTGSDWLEIRCDSLRKEPHFIFVKANSFSDKRRKVLELVNHLPHPMILYVNAPYEAEKWKTFLEENGYWDVKTFTGDTKSNYVDISVKALEKKNVSKEKCNAIRKLASRVRNLEKDLVAGKIGEVDYTEQCLWLMLEAMIKLLAAYAVVLVGEDVGEFISGVSALAFEYGRYTLYKKEQEILELYIARQKVVDDEIKQRMAEYNAALQAREQEFNDIIKDAFAPDVMQRFGASVALAQKAGVDDTEILKSTEQVDEFFS